MINISIGTEDILAEMAAEKILTSLPFEFYVLAKLRKQGNGYLKKNLTNFNQMAHNVSDFLLLTDLDMAECPLSVINDWRGETTLSTRLLFRIAVHETEAWLMADRNNFAEYLRIPVAKIPNSLDTVSDPKQLLLNLVRRYSPKKIRVELLPEAGSRAAFGMGYNPFLSTFIADHWQPDQAAHYSDSLKRTLDRLTAHFEARVLCGAGHAN